MEQHILTMGNYRLACQLPQQAVRQLVYFHSPVDDLTPPEDLLEQAGAAFLCITGEDWNADLTPWPAERVFAKGGDFGGRADRYLRVLTEELLPFAEHSLHAESLPRTLAGVSLSGLFAVYAAHRTDAFHRICSVSGSLWYDGFLDFMVQIGLACGAAGLSLGWQPGEKRQKPAHAPGGGLYAAHSRPPAAAGRGYLHGNQSGRPLCRRGGAPAQGPDIHSGIKTAAAMDKAVAAALFSLQAGMGWSAVRRVSAGRKKPLRTVIPAAFATGGSPPR